MTRSYNDTVLNNAAEILEELKERCEAGPLRVEEVWVEVETFSNKVNLKSARFSHHDDMDQDYVVDLHVTDNP